MTGETLGKCQAAVEMKHVLVASPLMQIINVLSDHSDIPTAAR